MSDQRDSPPSDPRDSEKDTEDDPYAGTLEKPRSEDEGGDGVTDPIPDA
ncbi:hypothetical protein DSM112329_01944 [Paraconexibacter sp. AEG42_29]|uniref:Uncharacterized protein n=1 Tax=Paraconexibacter sp. AEG42_29 TaxID=2997339 RepID=A0AAU7ATT7_9ACTN